MLSITFLLGELTPGLLSVCIAGLIQKLLESYKDSERQRCEMLWTSCRLELGTVKQNQDLHDVLQVLC